jgi:hypothetical protein
MVPIHIADDEEPCAGDEAKDSTRRTVEESREKGSVEEFFEVPHEHLLKSRS